MGLGKSIPITHLADRSRSPRSGTPAVTSLETPMSSFAKTWRQRRRPGVERVAKAGALTTPSAAPTAAGRARLFSTAWVIPAGAGALAALLLLGLYLGLVTWAQGLSHARDLLWQDRYFVAAIATGFAVQVGLFVHVRRVVSRRARGTAAAATATGTGTSTVAMVACCAHHVTDALPLLGLSGAALFLNDYRIALMAAGLAVNAAGVAFMLRVAIVQTRLSRKEAEAC